MADGEPGGVQVSYQSKDTRMLLGLAAVGVVGYLGYRYWYVPMKIRDAYNAQLAALQARGLSRVDAMGQLGGAACQAIAASYGVPPGADGGLCSQLGQAASQVLQQLPQIAAGLGSGAASLGAGLASAEVSLAKAPLQVLGYGLSGGWSGTKLVVHDVYGATKDVVRDVTYVPRKIVSGIGSAAKDVGHFIGKLF